MYAHTRGETASSIPSLPAAVPATQYRRLKTHLAIAWFGMNFFFQHRRQMTFGKHRLVKVKPFGKTPGTLPLQTPQNPKVEEKEMENEPSSG